PDGLPASMIWRRDSYRLARAAGPERLGAEWWRTGQRLQLVPPEPPQPAEPGKATKPAPYVPDLALFHPEAVTRDYYVVEDTEGRRFWVFRQGLYEAGLSPVWYLDGLFSCAPMSPSCRYRASRGRPGHPLRQTLPNWSRPAIFPSCMAARIPRN